jgi:Na+-transporting NADH:ubiquinone oxidoreductase subunit NqrF
MKYMVAELMFTAKKVWHENGMICILLNDNREVRFPVYLNKKLRNATESQVINIEIICGGTGLNWPELDEDLSVTGILEGKFGKV